jgi:hypothetical protein
MELNNKHVVKWCVRGLIIWGVILAAAVLLSSYYYRSFELNPTAVWHGANMGARTLLSNASTNERLIDAELISSVSKKLEKNQFDSSLKEPTDTTEISKMDHEIRNQIAANQARDRQLQQDLGRLEQVNQQLLNSKSTLNALNQDYSAIVAHNEIEAARRAEIQAALEDNADVPSEEDAQALISNRGRSAKASNPIPQTVLNNVQRTTGISPDEINELMNQ